MSETDQPDFEYFPIPDPPLHAQQLLKAVFQADDWSALILNYNELIYTCNIPRTDPIERCSIQFWASFYARERGKVLPVCNNQQMNNFFTMMMAGAVSDLGINPLHPNIYKYLEAAININPFSYQN